MRLPLALLLAAVAAAPASRAAPVGAPPVFPVQVVRTYPHDASAFTEGLFIQRGRLFESTGLEGQSDIREVSLADGRVLRRQAVPNGLFGEGIVPVRDQIVSVTWQTGRGFRWRMSDFKLAGRFTYPGEGWGMTTDGRSIILSDGTPRLRFLDPRTFAERRSVNITVAGRPLRYVNELEWVKGEVLANVWQTPLIVRIDPATGVVKGLVDLSPLAAANGARGGDRVANGIAYDAAHDRLFVTGKNWNKLYEVRIGPARR